MPASAFAKKEGLRHYVGALCACGALLAAIIAQLAGDGPALVLGLLFFLLGMSHGAADDDGDRIARIGLFQAFAYLVAGAAMVGIFIVFPLAALSLFLILSAWHFWHSDCALPPLAAGAIALLAVGGSALFKTAVTQSVFASILGVSIPAAFMYGLAAAGLTGLLLAFAVMIRQRAAVPEIAVTVVAVAILHPALAVGLVYLVGHALPVQLRQIDRFGLSDVVGASAVPTVIAAIGAIGLVAVYLAGIAALPIVAAIAFGLATPHMLVDRIQA